MPQIMRGACHRCFRCNMKVAYELEKRLSSMCGTENNRDLGKREDNPRSKLCHRILREKASLIGSGPVSAPFAGARQDLLLPVESNREKETCVRGTNNLADLGKRQGNTSSTAWHSDSGIPSCFQLPEAFGRRATSLSRQTVLLSVLVGKHFSGKIERRFVAQNVPHLTRETVAQTYQHPR